MRPEIAEAVATAISRNSAPGVEIKAAEIYDALKGVDYEDAVEVEPRVFDVWGTDDDGAPWRIEVNLISL